jgi:hypothetical protein
MASVGTVPTCLTFNYLAPSAWASISAMAAKLDKICQQVSTQGQRLDNYKQEIKMSVDHQVKLGQEDFYQRLEDFKIVVMQGTRCLGSRLDNVELCMIGLCNNNTPPAVHPENHG